MTSVAFTIQQTPNGKVEIQVHADDTTGTELESRLAGCLNHAVETAMNEVFMQHQNGISVSIR